MPLNAGDRLFLRKIIMDLQTRIEAFGALGDWIANLAGEERAYIHERAKAHNGWFTPGNVDLALEGLTRYLHRDALRRWLAPYNLPEYNERPAKVGVAMAGNIPLAGFHDFLSILVTGNTIIAKPSSQDPFLLKYIAEKLTAMEPRFKSMIEFSEQLKGMDAIIATGSDNTSRYFEYYFGKRPHIIRKNRVSAAVLSGNETPGDYALLGRDIFYYFGLGCRNVAKIFIPKGFDFQPFMEALREFDYVMDNHKYANNYQYNRSIYLLNKTPHLDAGFCLLHESEELVSPTSVIYYEYCDHPDEALNILSQYSHKIQCVVGDESLPGVVPFGKAQNPELWDYADNVDTIRFLVELNQRT